MKILEQQRQKLAEAARDAAAAANAASRAAAALPGVKPNTNQVRTAMTVQCQIDDRRSFQCLGDERSSA